MTFLSFAADVWVVRTPPVLFTLPVYARPKDRASTPFVQDISEFLLVQRRAYTTEIARYTTRTRRVETLLQQLGGGGHPLRAEDAVVLNRPAHGCEARHHSHPNRIENHDNCLLLGYAAVRRAYFYFRSFLGSLSVPQGK